MCPEYRTRGRWLRAAARETGTPDGMEESARGLDEVLAAAF
jgi:hypothetical protein